MASNQTTKAEKTVRAPVLPGTIVALIALIGADCAMAGRTAAERGHKSAVIAARAVTPTAMAARATTAKIVLVGASLLVMLLLSRQISCFAQRPTAVLSTVRLNATRPPRLRRKSTISYHTGGLYGP
ncbi:MAG TPA: hypothetical protein VMV94_11845 [Phycisphaerae bacterium]|nr:hypothetical protein [Phycisphaerae bacterium]